MPSSVIHIRLDDWALIGCYDILQKGGRETVNLPTATIVREVINGLVRKMQDVEYIPTYTNEQKLQRARELYGGEFSLEPDLMPGDIVSSSSTRPQAQDEDEDLSLHEIARRAAEMITDSTPHKVSTPVEISEDVDEPKARIQKVDILTLNSSLNFDDIRRLAPKDRFVEWASQHSEVEQKAVAICYSNVDRELWGSQRAEEIIQRIMETHSS